MKSLLLIISMTSMVSIIGCLGASPALGQSVTFSDALPEDPTATGGIIVWPSVAVRSGIAYAIPSDPKVDTYIGPVGWSLGVDAKLNIGHTAAVGLRYMYTHFVKNDRSFGRLEIWSVQETTRTLRHLYNDMESHEILAIAELPFVNQVNVRWSGLVGVGFGIEVMTIERHDVSNEPKLIGLSTRQDTGPAFALGTTLEYFPADFISISLGVQASYRYSPNLSLEEGALILQGLFGVEGHF